MGKSYRPCIVAVFQNDAGLLLVGERTNLKGTWQFPQGGVDPGESDTQALRREVREEIGIEDFDIIQEGSKTFAYEFPGHLKAAIAKKYQGQKQRWFLCRLLSAHPPDLTKAIDQEFSVLQWMNPKQVYSGIVDWKKETYRNAMLDLGLEI